MFLQSLGALGHGFTVALAPDNLVWSLAGVLLGNLIGVLPGIGALSAISMLLPLTYTLHPIPAILMLAGIYYGSQYGGAIGAILLNMPSHPPHAVTCLDGYPMTRAGRGGVALGITMMSSFFAASVGILVMIFASPLLVDIAFKFGPADMFSIMLLGLVAGGTMSRGPALKGVAMAALGLLIGIVGTDINTGTRRFTFGMTPLDDGVELVALALGLFGVADFLLHIGSTQPSSSGMSIRLRDMCPTREEFKRSLGGMLRGTLVGILFGGIPGTGSTITTFIAYALEKKISRDPGKFGHGAIEGVAAPEASAHSKTQVDFIPTLTLGIPGDPVMALLLGALLIQGIQPGPQLITEHADLFWGLIASFWVGNVILVILNTPLIGVWVRLLRIPYRMLFPAAMFFIAIGVFSTDNSLFEVQEVLFFGVLGALLMSLNFSVAPILLGYVLGPMVETNFRRALLMSHGNLEVFVHRPISACFLAACALLVIAQLVFWMRRLLRDRKQHRSLREFRPLPADSGSRRC